MKLHEMAAGNFGQRPWYHGTTKRRYKQILKQGSLVPALADDRTFGEAIWFTSDFDEASDFGEVVFEINNQDVRHFRNKKISELPYGFKKRFGVKSPTSYSLVIFDEIPLEYLEVHT